MRIYVLFLMTALVGWDVAASHAAPVVFDLQPGINYEVSGPFANAGGFVVGNVTFSGSPGASYSPPNLNYPADQAGYLVSASLNGAEFNDGGSTNPGPEYFMNTGIIGISMGDPIIQVGSVSGYGWYKSAATGYVSYPLDDPTGFFDLTLPDYGSPWVVTPIPEPSIWAMMILGFLGVGAIALRCLSPRGRQPERTFKRGPGMRAVVSSLFLFLLAGSGHASIYSLPLNGTVFVSGPNFPSVIDFEADIAVTNLQDLGYLGLGAYGIQHTFLYSTEVSGQLPLIICGGYCAGEYQPTVQFQIPYNFRELDITTGGTAVNLLAEPQLSVTVDLPPGFFISDTLEITGVPEPSTWAMILIGFAAIGFAGYRRQHTF